MQLMTLTSLECSYCLPVAGSSAQHDGQDMEVPTMSGGQTTEPHAWRIDSGDCQCLRLAEERVYLSLFWRNGVERTKT